jgi:hypothetical protein
MKTIEIECQTCKGSGLYQGLAERGKSAVVCNKCQGSGKDKFFYNEFTGRKTLSNVERVFAGSFGYVHTDKNTAGILFEEGGCTYQEWLKGEKPKPVKDLYCPHFWDRENLKGRCDVLLPGDKIPDCPYFKEKAKCWEAWEKKQREAKNERT